MLPYCSNVWGQWQFLDFFFYTGDTLPCGPGIRGDPGSKGLPGFNGNYRNNFWVKEWEFIRFGWKKKWCNWRNKSIVEE